MLSNKIFLAVSAWTAVVCAQPDPKDKPVAFPSGLAVLDTANGGLNNMPMPSYTIKQWPRGRLPMGCYDLATDPYAGPCLPDDVEVYDVTYSDVRISHSFSMQDLSRTAPC